MTFSKSQLKGFFYFLLPAFVPCSPPFEPFIIDWLIDWDKQNKGLQFRAVPSVSSLWVGDSPARRLSPFAGRCQGRFLQLCLSRVILGAETGHQQRRDVGTEQLITVLHQHAPLPSPPPPTLPPNTHNTMRIITESRRTKSFLLHFLEQRAAKGHNLTDALSWLGGCCLRPRPLWGDWCKWLGGGGEARAGKGPRFFTWEEPRGRTSLQRAREKGGDGDGGRYWWSVIGGGGRDSYLQRMAAQQRPSFALRL